MESEASGGSLAFGLFTCWTFVRPHSELSRRPNCPRDFLVAFSDFFSVNNENIRVNVQKIRDGHSAQIRKFQVCVSILLYT